MANPQLENGHTKIANEIIEKFCRYRLSGEEWKVLWVVLRKTYGWNKKEDSISLSQFCLLTDMDKSSIIRAIHKLVTKKLLAVDKNATSFGNKYLFNKNFDTWKQLTKKSLGVTKKSMTVDNLVNQGVTKKSHTNNNYTNTTITKDILSANADGNYIKLLISSKRKDLQVIGYLAESKSIKWDNVEQARNFVKRNLKPAKELKEYSSDRIKLVMNYLESSADFKWTLESVLKYIDEPKIK